MHAWCIHENNTHSEWEKKEKKTLIEYIFKKMHSEAQNVCKPFDFIHGRVQIAFITNSIELLMKTK